jgi:hypothetical protein
LKRTDAVAWSIGGSHHEDRSLIESPQKLTVKRQASLGIEDDTTWLAGTLDSRRQQRIVYQCSADADRDGVAFGAPLVDQLSALGAGDPGRIVWVRRGLAVEGHRHLQDDQRQTSAGVFAERLIEAAGCRGLGAGGKCHVNPSVAQDAGAAPSRLLAGVLGGDHHTSDPRLEDGLDAWGLPPLMGAGLQRHVHRRPIWVLAATAAVLQRRSLSVQPAEFRVKPLTDDLPVAHDHRADQRIRADAPPPALSQLQRPPKVRLIRG